jgi:hypothetical protein
MSEQKIVQYKNVLLKFLDEINEQFPDESDILLIKFCVSKVSTNILFNMFNKMLHKDNCNIKKMIRDRNHDFFLSYNECFDFFPFAKNKIKYYYDFWNSNKLDDDTRSIIWDWIDSLVDIVDSYNSEKFIKKEYSKVLTQLKYNIKNLDKFIDRLQGAHIYNKRIDICTLFPKFIFENGDISYAISVNQCK